MMKAILGMIVIPFFFSLVVVVKAFVPPSQRLQYPDLLPTVSRGRTGTGRSTTSRNCRQSALCMVPKYDKVTQKWYPTDTEVEGPGAGYPLVNTLLLHGPKPFVQRVLNPDEYEQAVLKFMAIDKCDRQEAMGNMDAFLKNPNDWAYDRVTYENRGGYKPDYVTLRPRDAVKTIVWSILVLTFGGRTAWALLTGNSFNAPWF